MPKPHFHVLYSSLRLCLFCNALIKMMRLLSLSGDGEFTMNEFSDQNIPKYAILSHTWEGGNQEVTFHDFISGFGGSKKGFDKIRFCGAQAQKDGLKYFWIDTCCIDKSSSAEITEAINSMFRWYQNSAACYVYLSDVSTVHTPTDSNPRCTWKLAFRNSKWFTRGWTLQELIAPRSVEFFSKEGERLGDKSSLGQSIK
jgi:hypothetical protein